MLRLTKTLLLLVGLLFLSPGAALGQYYFTGKRPNKLVNAKVGLAYQKFYSDSGSFCGDRNRINGVFGLQTAYFPFTVDLSFYTDISLELYAGGYWPITRLGRWGWLVVHGGAFWRTTKGDFAADDELLCDGPQNSDALDTFGVGATVEYLMYDGYLGFFIESRQTFVKPLLTTVSAGVDISPLLWLMFRNY